MPVSVGQASGRSGRATTALAGATSAPTADIETKNANRRRKRTDAILEMPGARGCHSGVCSRHGNTSIMPRKS